MSPPPFSLIRSISASGKARSRPTMTPTLVLSAIFSALHRSCRLAYAVHGLLRQKVDNRLQVTALLEDPLLAIGAGALLQDHLDRPQRGTAPQVVHHVVHELQELVSQLAHRHLLLLAKVDEVAVDAVDRKSTR